VGARIRHLTSAPIEEALVDIRVQAPEGFDASTFEGAKAELSKGYPIIRPQQMFQTTFGLQDGQPLAPSTSSAQAGLFFYSADERTVVQFRIDGFTFNKLKPYSSWEQIFPETWRLWCLYRDLVRPVHVPRLGVRNINRMPLPSNELSRYLAVLPTIPPELPQEARSFLTSVMLYDSQRQVSANLTQALESPLDGPSVTVLLDIDAFTEFERIPTDDEVRTGLDALHTLKNQVFFGSITEETARMFA